MVSLFCARSRAAIAAMLITMLPTVSTGASVDVFGLSLTATIEDKFPSGRIVSPVLAPLFGKTIDWSFAMPSNSSNGFIGHTAFSLDGSDPLQAWRGGGQTGGLHYRNTSDGLEIELSFGTGRIPDDDIRDRYNSFRLTLVDRNGSVSLVDGRPTSMTMADFEEIGILATSSIWVTGPGKFRYWEQRYSTFASVDSLSFQGQLVAPVPLPASAPLLMVAVVGLIAFRRRAPV